MATGLATPTTPRGRCCLSSCRSKHQKAFGQCQGGWTQMWVWPALLSDPSPQSLPLASCGYLTPSPDPQLLTVWGLEVRQQFTSALLIFIIITDAK